MAKTGEEFYFLNRDEVETARLEFQHDFLIDLTGGSPIHESIPKDRLSSIADVATGTGVWLRDVQRRLDGASPSATDRPRYYHGFDISDAQFPKNKGSIQYSVHDCFKPFPPEHHNRYDLVHVRLLVSAVKASDFKLIIANLVPLLKPGGCLQWEDLDLISFLDAADAKYDGTPAMNLLKMCIETEMASGISPHVPEVVAEGARAAGLVNVRQIDYQTGDRPELASTTQEWVLRTFGPLSRAVLLRSGRVSDRETVEIEAEKYLEGTKATFEQGFIPNGTMGMILAQKH